MPPSDVVIVGAARTPIGRYGGSLKGVHPADLVVEASVVESVLVGHARQAGSGPNPARQVAIRAGIPAETPALTVNQACASGMQTIAIGAQSMRCAISRPAVG